MISDEELATDLAGCWSGVHGSRQVWEQIARRARELLLPPEAEAVLKAAADETAAEEYTVRTGGNGAPEITDRREDRRRAVRAYRAQQQPKPRYQLRGAPGEPNVYWIWDLQGGEFLHMNEVCDLLNREDSRDAS